MYYLEVVIINEWNKFGDNLGLIQNKQWEAETKPFNLPENLRELWSSVVELFTLKKLDEVWILEVWVSHEFTVLIGVKMIKFEV